MRLRQIGFLTTALALSLTQVTAHAADQPPAAPDQTDVLMLEQAKTACAAAEFKGFFEAFVLSQAVRAAYTADSIDVSVAGKSAPVARADYTGFPIALIDYYWVSANSVVAVLADPKAELEHLKLQWNQSQTNIWRIDWQRVRYDGKSEGGDDLGNVIETYGQPGYLLFTPTETCWNLTQDTVGGPSAGLTEP